MGGMSKGIVQISTSIVADVTSPESRTKGMVMLFFFFHLINQSIKFFKNQSINK